MSRPSRMNFELSSKSRKRLEKLANETDQGMSDVIRRALSIYNYLYEQSKLGNSVLVQGPEENKEIVFSEFLD